MKHRIPISLLFILSGIFAQSQETRIDYQIILESKAIYNNPDNHSPLNPDNRMGIEELTSVTQLYPVLTFGHRQDDFSATLQIEGNIKNHNFAKDSTEFSFQELYMQFSAKEKHYISVGKRRLSWGNGTIWNPTNFHTQKDPLRTQNRLEGIFQASYSLLLPKGTLQGYIFPEKRLKDFSYALKYDHYGNRIDASLLFLQYTKYQQFGYAVSYGGNISTIYSEGILRNYSKSHKVGETGVLISPTDNRNKFRTEIVTGFSINCNAHISLRGEYRFREDHLNKTEIKRFKNNLPQHTLLYDPISMGRHSAFGYIEWKDLYDRLFMQLRSFYDPVSSQLIVSPLLIWKFNNLQVEVSSMIYNNAIPLYNYQGSILLSYHF